MKITAVFTFLLISGISYAQNDTPRATSNDDAIVIRGVIDSLFIGMKQGDSSMVASLFHEDLRLMTTYLDKDSVGYLVTDDALKFLEAIGTPHDQVWDERISDVIIQVDDNLGQAWMNYSFYADDTFSHCGVNAFQFFKTERGWKIIQLIDTRRRTACD